MTYLFKMTIIFQSLHDVPCTRIFNIHNTEVFHVLHFSSFYYTLCQISVQPRCQHVYLKNIIINSTTDNKWLVDLTCILVA